MRIDPIQPTNAQRIRVLRIVAAALCGLGVLLVGANLAQADSDRIESQFSTFNEAWKRISQPRAADTAQGLPEMKVYHPTDDLPQHELKMSDLLAGASTLVETAKGYAKSSGRGDKSCRAESAEEKGAIYRAAKETLSGDQSDFWSKPRKKLIRPNGICLAGKWKMDDEATLSQNGVSNPYSGLFSPGSEHPFIGRASVAFDITTSGKFLAGHFRSFGLAGKVFPTTQTGEKAKDEPVTTANFFMIDDNAGTFEKNFTNAELLTQAKVTMVNIFARFSLKFIKLVSTIKDAQHCQDPEHYQIRQLYPLSESGPKASLSVKAPALMKVVGSEETARLNRKYREKGIVSRPYADFRDELRVENYGENGLVFDVMVAAENVKKPDWKKIGRIIVEADAVSDVCDQELRFAHPVYDASKDAAPSSGY